MFRLILDFLIMLTKPRRHLGSPSKIAILRLDEVGDFFLWLPFALALRKHFAQAHITLIGNPLWLQVAETCLPFDDFVEVSPRKITDASKYRSRICRELSSRNFTMVINPRISRYVFLDDLLQLSCRAPQNVAFAYTRNQAYHWEIGLLQKIMNHLPGWKLIPHSSVHELENNDCFLRSIAPNAVPVPFFLPQKRLTTAPYFLIFPEAGKDFREWPLAKFCKVGDILRKKTNTQGYLCGRIHAKISSDLIDLRGKISLTELVRLISGADFVIGNDSGPVHIAAALGVPSFALVGGGGSQRFFPYPVRFNDCFMPPHPVFGKICRHNCNWMCPFSNENPRPCIQSITVWQVIQKVERTLGK